MKLTNKNVEQLSIEKNGYIVWDSEVKGFGVRVNLNSKKTFILKFRVGQGREAKVRKPVIGTFGVMKVEEARKIARKWLLEASEGNDPKEVDKTNMMLKDFCEVYIQQYAKIKKKQSSVEEDKRLMRLHILPSFGKVCIKDITRAMITKHHQTKYTSYETNKETNYETLVTYKSNLESYAKFVKRGQRIMSISDDMVKEMLNRNLITYQEFKNW